MVDSDTGPFDMMMIIFLQKEELETLKMRIRIKKAGDITDWLDDRLSSLNLEAIVKAYPTWMETLGEAKTK